MDFQTIIVAAVICAALLYIARRVLLKTKSFAKKSDCGNDCGCGE